MMDEPWTDDRLNRSADGEHLIKVLLAQYEARKANGDGSYILNIDAAWGQGKTFFLENLRADLQKRGHIVASVNAWRDDHADDPLVTIMAAIEDELTPFFPDKSIAFAAWEKGKKALGTVASETAKQVGFHTLKLVTGITVEKIIEKLAEDKVLSRNTSLDEDAYDKSAEKVWDKGLEALVSERVNEHRSASQGIVKFRHETARSIASVLGNGMLAPMFVMIDELDRCRPLYAIRLLEDLKHLFHIEGLVFVVATDTDQLSHSVKAIYGAEFEARKYLRRFFDRTFVFPETQRRDFIGNTFARLSIDIEKCFFATGQIPPLTHIENWADGLKITNRDIVQMSEIIATFVTSFEHSCKIEPNYLLGLVTSFYNSDEYGFETLRLGTSGKPQILERWMISQLERETGSGATVKREVNAGSFLINLRSHANQPLRSLAHPAQGNSNTSYFREEFNSRFSNVASMVPEPRSVLVEFASRVRNAGRVLDRV